MLSMVERARYQPLVFCFCSAQAQRRGVKAARDRVQRWGRVWFCDGLSRAEGFGASHKTANLSRGIKLGKTVALTRARIFERALFWMEHGDDVAQGGGGRASVPTRFMGLWQAGQSGGGGGGGGGKGGGFQFSSARVSSPLVLAAALQQTKGRRR